MSERRAVLEAIAYGDDPKVSPGDRLRALEMLHAEFGAPPAADDGLSEDEILAQVDEFHSVMLATMLIASGVAGELDPAQFPKTSAALRDVVDRQVERALANRILEAEQQRQERERDSASTTSSTPKRSTCLSRALRPLCRWPSRSASFRLESFLS